MAEPLISIIIPTYQRYYSLCQAIDSVIAQSYRHWELLVVEDGSAPELQQALAQRYCSERRFRLLPQSQHSGFAGAMRNLALEDSRGSYIAFLDSDDLWLPDKLRLQLQQHGKLRHCRERWWRYASSLEQLAAVSNASSCCFKEQKRLHGANFSEVSQAKQRHQRAGDIFDDSLQKCIVGPSTVLLDRKLFERYGLFRADLQVAEDYELWLRFSAYEPASYLDEALVIKRDHPKDGDQLSQRYPFIEYFRIEALAGLLEQQLLPLSHRSKVKVKLAEKLSIWVNGASKRGRKDQVASLQQRVEKLLH